MTSRSMTMLAVTLLSLAAVQTAQADTVTCSGINLSCSPSSATVGAGTEFAISIGGISVFTADFGTGALTISQPFLAGFGTGGGFSLSFTNLTSHFTGFNLLNMRAVTGFNASDISLVNDILSVDLSNTLFRQGGFVTIGLQTAVVPGPVAGAGLPALLALSGLLWARRRREAASRPA